MPTVLRSGPFQVRINTDDHIPPHVHVVGKTGVIVIDLAVEGAAQSIRWVQKKMTMAERRAAFRLVAENTQKLYDDWREIHGDKK